MIDLRRVLERQEQLERVLHGVTLRSAPSLPDDPDPDHRWDVIPAMGTRRPQLVAYRASRGGGMWFVGVVPLPHGPFLVGFASREKLAAAGAA